MGIFGRISDIFKPQEKQLSKDEIYVFENQRQFNILPENIVSFQPSILTLELGRMDIGYYVRISVDEQGFMEGKFSGNGWVEIKTQLSENQILDLRFILAFYNFFEIKSEKSRALQNYSFYAQNQSGKENTIYMQNIWSYFQPLQDFLIEDIITCLQIRKYFAFSGVF